MVPPGWAQEVASSSQPGSDSIPVVVSEMARHRGSDTAGMEEQFKILMDGQAASCQRGLTSPGNLEVLRIQQRAFTIKATNPGTLDARARSRESDGVE